MRIYSVKYFIPLLHTSSSFLFISFLSYHFFPPFHHVFLHFLFTLESGSDSGLSLISLPITSCILCLHHTILLLLFFSVCSSSMIYIHAYCDLVVIFLSHQCIYLYIYINNRNCSPNSIITIMPCGRVVWKVFSSL